MTTKIKSGVISDNAITSAHISSGAISSAHLTSIDTDNITEGSSNLYFTTARARTSFSVTDSGGDGSLAYNNSTGVITYTGPSASEVQAHISVTDSGGDGSLAYSNGVITYTGPSASEVRAHLSAGTGVTYSSGEFSIGQSVATTASPTFADINITGDLNLTGDINSYSVTDLDIVDQTITLGVGQSESASGGSGIVVAGSNASILWDESNDEFDFNKGVNITGGLNLSGDIFGTSNFDIRSTGNIFNTYGNSSNVYFRTQDGTNRAIITSTGKVGIGTSNPNALLHIKTADPATNQAVIDFRNPTYGIFAQTNSISSRGNTLEFIASDYNSNSPTTHNVLTMRPEGNVGIVNDSPSYLLEVGNASQTNSNVFSGRVNGDFIFNLSKANTNLFSIRNNNTGIVHLNTQNSATLALGVSTGTTTGSIVSSLTINSAGNVGIGQTNPQFDLDVTGLIRATSDVYFQGDVYVDSKIRHNGDVDNYITFSAADTQGFITGNSTRLQITNSLVRLNQENNNQDFSVYSANSDNMLYVDASTDRVGIGTASPIARLHIQDNTSTVYDATAYQHDLFIEKRNTAGSNQVSSIRFGVTGHDGSTTAEASIGVLQTSNAHSGNLVFGTRHSGTRAERMRITSDGKVGIGTNDPNFALDISNTTSAKINIQGGTNQNGIRFAAAGNDGVSSSLYYLGVGSDLMSGTDYGAVLLDVTNNRSVLFDDQSTSKLGFYNNSMVIKSNGNVGIGVSNPGYKLAVSSKLVVGDAPAVGLSGNTIHVREGSNSGIHFPLVISGGYSCCRGCFWISL
jgi:hypothetical protein